MKASDNVTGAWQQYFQQEFDQPYMKELSAFLRAEKQAGKTIYPPSPVMFNTFQLTPLEDVKVVIVGQDPYHGPGQAHGLCFSVQMGVQPPPSLKNIYKELNRDLGLAIPSHGNLESWGRQGVMLLNTVLTVERGVAASHQGKGWERFTQGAISLINSQCEHVVFLAWGRHAHRVCADIDRTRHLVIQTSHPSPLGATKAGRNFSAFLGSGCFSEANRWLLNHQRIPVNWSLN